MGGRTDDGFTNDVWRYTFSGAFCSLSWQGKWVQITKAASWAPRYGHSVIGFSIGGGDAIETVLIMGGFGGDQIPERVGRQPQKQPIYNHNDIWCGYAGSDNFTTWTQLMPRSPFSKRSMAAVVVAPTIAEIAFLVFGGYDTNSRHRVDFWRWIGENATATCKMELVTEKVTAADMNENPP